MTNADLRDSLPTIEANSDVSQESAANTAAKGEKIGRHAAMPAVRKGLSGGAKALIAALIVLVVAGGGTAAALKTGVISFDSAKQSEDAAAPATAVADAPKKMVTSKVDGALVYYKMATRGTAIEVTGEDGAYYAGTVDGVNVLVEKKWVRLASAAQPTAWKGYSNDMAPLFKTAYLMGDPVATLPLNTEVEVLDGQDDWLFVKTADGAEGYARAADFRTEDQKRAEDEAAEAEAAAQEEYVDDGGWYDGGWYDDSSSGTYYYEPEPAPAPAPDPEPAPAPAPSGNDGQEITLVSYRPAVKPFVETAYAAEESSQSAAASKGLGKGVILSDGVSLYLAKLDRGDQVEQLDFTERGGDSSATIMVKVDDAQGTIARSIVTLEDDAPFVAVDAYARDGATVFEDYQLLTAKRTCAVNDVLRLVDEYDANYVVEEKGIFTYVPKDSVSLTKIEVKQEEEPAVEEEQGESEWTEDYYEEPYYDGGYYYEETYTPSYEPAPEPEPEPAPAPEPTEEWTDAKL